MGRVLVVQRSGLESSVSRRRTGSKVGVGVGKMLELTRCVSPVDRHRLVSLAGCCNDIDVSAKLVYSWYPSNQSRYRGKSMCVCCSAVSTQLAESCFQILSNEGDVLIAVHHHSYSFFNHLRDVDNPTKRIREGTRRLYPV